MSIYPIVSEQDLKNLRKLAEQQKNQRAPKIKNRILKQTYDGKIAESLSPMTKKLDETTKNLVEVFKKSNSEKENNQEVVFVEIESEDDILQTNLRTLPKSSISSNLMTKTFGWLTSCPISLSITAPASGPTILGIRIFTLGGDRLQIRDIVYDLTPEIHKALSYTRYNGNTMKTENDILMMNNNIRVLGYTGDDSDRDSKRKIFLKVTFPELVEKIQNKTFEESTDDSDDLQGDGVKIVITSNIIDIHTRLEILLGLKITGQTDSLTEE